MSDTKAMIAVYCIHIPEVWVLLAPGAVHASVCPSGVFENLGPDTFRALDGDLLVVGVQVFDGADPAVGEVRATAAHLRPPTLTHNLNTRTREKRVVRAPKK